ncbi:MAG: 30S ribosomal protein S4 [Nanoarchaeota archaeon]
MKRKHKLYSNPKKPFDKLRIEEEKKIREEFGLKNKKEIWKAKAKVKLVREKARKLIKSPPEKQKVLFDQLREIGIKADSLTDAFALDTKNYLERRLQTVVFKKGLANTIKESRQKIVHRKVLVDGKVINKPSYLVPVELENKITIKEKQKIKKEVSTLKGTSENKNKTPNKINEIES